MWFSWFGRKKSGKRPEVNVTEAQKNASALKHRLAIEELTTLIATDLINVKSHNLEQVILKSLEKLAVFAQVDRSYLYLISDDQKRLECFSKWWNPKIGEEGRGLFTIERSMIPWWWDRLQGHKVVHLPNCKALPNFAENENRLFVEQRICSLLDVPIFVDGQWVALIGFDTLREEKTWLEPDIHLLRMLGQLFVGAVEQRKSQERTQKLTNLLHESQKLEALGQLSAGVAHDLNNSLSAIGGHLELIRMNGADSSSSSESIDLAIGGCERSARLVKQLLGFAKRGSYEDLKPHSVKELLSGNISFIKNILGKNVRIIVDRPREDFQIEVDENQIHQVVTNLLLNANQAMPNGGTIRIRFKRQKISQPVLWNASAKPGNYIVFTIEDTGTGIDPANLSRIFDPFFSTKGQTGGTGLGLSMAYGTLQNHRGWITVESKLGTGTQFSLFFPEAVSVAQVQPIDSVSDLDQRNILIIDSEPVLTNLMERFLDKASLRYTSFTSATEALSWYHDNWEGVDLVLLDMKMPEMSGKECFFKLRSINPACLVALCSGDEREQDVNSLLFNGAVKFFTKPLQYARFVEWIIQTLDTNDRAEKSINE